MSTGDLKNHGTRLQSLLRTTKYPSDINFSSLFYGYPQEYLPLLHFLFQAYSLSFSKYLLKRGYEMSGKTDKQFIDVVYRVLRDEFEYIPKLSKEKFFSTGYTEQKLILTCTAYQYVIDKCRSSRKQKSKSVSNKENVHPSKTQREIPKSKQEIEPTRSSPISVSKPVTSEPATTLPSCEYSPMRKPPQPITSQHYNLSEVIEESIIEVPGEESATLDSVDDNVTPQTKIYSEEGAREVFALDHLAGSVVDIVDSTPHTVLNKVQLVPVSQTSDTVPRVNVTREVGNGSDSQSGEGVAMATVKEVESGSCSTHCPHSADIAAIKQMLVTINARLDILECKAKHSGTLGYLPESVQTFPSTALPTPSFGDTFPITPVTSQVASLPAPDLSASDFKENKFLEKQSSKSVTFDEEKSPSSSVSNSVEENEDDIKDFLKSVREKLNDTRSFLRTYDITQA